MAFTLVAGSPANDTLLSAGSTTVNNVLGAAIAVGDVVRATVTWESAVTLSSLADTLSNTWSIGYQTTANSKGMAICYSIATSAGTPTVTATFSGTATWRGIMLDAYNEDGGTPTFGDADGQSQVNPGTGANAVTTPNMTAAGTSSLVLISAMPTTVLSDRLELGTGYTESAVIDDGGTDGPKQGYDLTASGTTVAATATLSIDDTTICAGLVFNPPVAGGATRPAGTNRGLIDNGLVGGGLVRRQMEKIIRPRLIVPVGVQVQGA